MKRLTLCMNLLVVVCTLSIAADPANAQSNVRAARQGYSMSLAFDNRGSAGRVAYSGVIPQPDSLPGLEYPIGSGYEHLFGMGLWVGGILDTSTGPAPSLVRAVTTGYEGWQGPYFEFYPGSSPADSIWKVNGRGVPRPSDWDVYWGNLVPHVSFSDNDHYCLYDDSHVPVNHHIPLKLKVAQSSFVWSDLYAEAVHIMEYRIVNTGAKRIDSAYVGVFVDPVPYAWSYTEYYYFGWDEDVGVGYSYRDLAVSSTLVGIVLLSASRPLDSLRHSFRSWAGVLHPNSDTAKYRVLSSGITDTNRLIPSGAEPRFLVSIGPFNIHPATDLSPDTIIAVFGLISGQDLAALRQHALHARAIYENGGVVGVRDALTTTPAQFELFQNYPNPFNPLTIIRFSLPTAAHIRLSIFNMLGAEVAVLVNNDVLPGVHSAEWNATGYASGVYICRLTDGGRTVTTKLILLR